MAARREEGRQRVIAVARADFGDVARLPGGAVRRRQRNAVDRATRAAGVEVLALRQRPGFVTGRTPVRQVGAARQASQMVLPMAQGAGVAAVHVHGVEQRQCAALAQPVLQGAAEAAEGVIAAVAKRQQAEAKLRQRRGPGKHASLKSAQGVRSLAFAEGAGHHQQARQLRQCACIQRRQRRDADAHAGLAQGGRGLPGQAFGRAGLAGVGHHDLFRGRRACGRPGCASRRDEHGALFLPAIQVEHPSADGEQRHGEAGHGEQQQAGQAEEAAAVQRQDAGHDLLAGRLVVVAFVGAHGQRGGVQHEPVVGALVRRVRVLVGEFQRLPGGGGNAQRQRGARGDRGIERGERGSHVGLGRCCLCGAVSCGRAAAPLATVATRGRGLRVAACRRTAALCRHRRARDRIQAAAIPLVGPEQARERHHQIGHHHPRADDRMQVPQKAAALERPVQPQPRAPVAPATRPAQVQARQAEEHQRHRGRADDLLSHVIRRQPAMDLHRGAEEALAPRLAQQLAAVRIDVAVLAAHAAAGAGLRVGRGREADAGAVAGRAGKRQRGDGLGRFGGGDARQQFVRRQRRPARGGHGHHAGVHRLEQVVLERKHRTRHADNGEHQPGGDAQEPMDLEDGVLEHALARVGRQKS